MPERLSMLGATALCLVLLAGCSKFGRTASDGSNSIAQSNPQADNAFTGHADGKITPATLTKLGETDLPKYTGDFDHFAIDTKDDRVFLAGEESHELEVFDRGTGKIIAR